jgi:PPOX class probable F420-dependent enzyme
MDGPLAVLDPTTQVGAWAQEHLADDIVGWLTTTAPDGTPQSSVIAFLWNDESVLLYSQPGALKVRNIAAHLRVAFHLQCDPFGKHMLTLEGVAAPDQTAASGEVWEEYLDKNRDAFAEWGMDPAEAKREYSLPIRIRPTKIRVY